MNQQLKPRCHRHSILVRTFKKRRWLLSCVSLILLQPPVWAQESERITRSVESVAPPIVDLGSRRELFVDTQLIATMSGAVLELQIPQIGELSLDFREKPWEGPWAGQGPTILKDGRVYRMYYFAPMSSQRVGPETNGSTAYAESRDGITWTRPRLGQFVYNGSTDNNILLLPDNIHPFHLIRPFIDSKPGVPSSQKYKAVAGGAIYTGADGGQYTDGLYILVSADGLHWSKYADAPFLPAQRFSSPDGQKNYPNPVDYDGMNTAFWSESEQRYVCLYRSWIRISPLKFPDDSYGGTGWYRWIKKTTSSDLVNWSTPVFMDTGGVAPEQWYMHAMAPYFRASQFFVGMPSHYISVANPDFPDSINSGHVARCESRFTVCRAGTIKLDRTFASRRFITTGLPNDPGFFFTALTGWPVFAGRMGLNVVPITENEMSCYLEQAGRVVRYKLRTDGFVAVSAKDSAIVVTKLITFTGNQLQLNYSTGSGGSLKIELEDAGGNPFTGYALSDATLPAGDYVSKQVTWNHKSAIGSLAGKTIRIKFLLRHAKLYAYRFLSSSQQDTETSPK